MTHNLTFKVATLRNAKDGEPKVVSYDIPKFVKMVAKPKVSDTRFLAYHNQKADQKRFDKEAREARETGDKDLANELKLKSKAKKDALSGTKDGKAMMPFTFKDDLTFKVIKDDWKQRDNDQIDAFSLIMLDIESKISKEEIHEALKDFEYVLWPTITHTVEDPRFRVVLFPEAPLPIDDAQALIFRIDVNLPSRNPITAKTRAVDPASLDVGRLMYLPLWLIDHPNAYFYVYNEGTLINANSFKLRAAQLLEVAERAVKSDKAKANRRATSIKAALTRTTDDSSLIEKNGTVWLNPNGQLMSDSGWHTIKNINGKISGVSCPAHGDTNGSEWVSLNSHTGRPQLNCKHCGTIKMLPEESDREEPEDKLVLVKRKKSETSELAVEPTLKAKRESVGLVMQEPVDMFNYDQQYLPNDLILALPKKGIMLVKSPKGTGKTEFLKSVAEQCAKENKSTLLLGHRVFLLKNIAERTGLDYYRDIEDREMTDGIAICMNSLTRVDPLNDTPYHTVIIDESEQVWLHLASKTLAHDRATVFNNLIWVLKNAKRIICLDADLTYQLTIELLLFVRGVEKVTDDGIVSVINEYKFKGRTTTIYEDVHQLKGEFFQAAQEGKRCYVATNSATEAHVFGEIMKKMNVPHLVITSFTNETPECLSFIGNPTEESKQYHVIIASPTAQTGISIDANPDGTPQFDVIYGFFKDIIGTYFDIDQALSRVRNCNDTRAWVPAINHKLDVESEGSIMKHVVEKERATRMVIIGEEHTSMTKGELLWAKMYSRITHVQKLWQYEKLIKFFDLREDNGYTMVFADFDPVLMDLGRSIYKESKHLVKDDRADQLWAARDISVEEFEELRDKKVRSQEEKALYDRARYKGLLGDNFSFENVVKAIEQNIFANLKRLRNATQMDDEQRKSYDAAARTPSAHTFTDFMHVAVEVALLKESCKAAGLDFDFLVDQACEYVKTGREDLIEIEAEKLVKFAEFFNSKAPEFRRHFKNPRFNDATQKLKGAWDATCGVYGLPLVAKRVGPRGGQVQKYFINTKKNDLVLEVFDKVNGKY